MSLNRIFLDTETTGLLKPDAASIDIQPRITELCLVKLDVEYNLIDEFDTFVNPGVPIPEEITQITGITDEHVRYAPTFLNLYPKLCQFFLGEMTSVGHNVVFDMGLLYCELARLGLEFRFPWTQEWVCTVEKSFSIQGHRLKLSQLHELATGKEHEGAHRAKADVYALIRCFHYLDIKLGLI